MKMTEGARSFRENNKINKICSLMVFFYFSENLHFFSYTMLLQTGIYQT